VWFICKRIPFGSLAVSLLLFIHFLLSMFFSVLWLGISYGSWYLYAGQEIFEHVQFSTIIGWQFLFGMITYLLIAGVFYTMIYYKQFREKELRETELKLLTRDAEFKALKAQINPHFLFNSLNSINAFVTQAPKQARHMISRLSDLLRISLENRDKMLVPLKEELDFAHLYLEIEKIRFQDRLVYKEQVDPKLLGFLFPAMVFQPLLENAVKYGIAEKRGKGVIDVSIQRRGENIQCMITNLVSNSLKNRPEKGGKGTGLDNIRKRLDLIFPGAYDFQTFYHNSNRFTASLSIPLRSRWNPSKP
jgi:sensor histidine kinase YesM